MTKNRIHILFILFPFKKSSFFYFQPARTFTTIDDWPTDYDYSCFSLWKNCMDSRCGLTTWCMSMAQVTVYAVYRGLRVFPRPASRSCAYVASLLLVGIVVSLCYRGRRRFFGCFKTQFKCHRKGDTCAETSQKSPLAEINHGPAGGNNAFVSCLPSTLNFGVSSMLLKVGGWILSLLRFIALFVGTLHSATCHGLSHVEVSST